MNSSTYYTGGLAEFVPNPSPLTYSFLARWFTGQHSIGKAMKLLGLPYKPIHDSLVVLSDGEMLVDSHVEFKTLYEHTVFSYAQAHSVEHTPHLTIDYSKLFFPHYWKHTLQLLFKQSLWIAKPREAVEHARHLLNSIPNTIRYKDLPSIDDELEQHVWPQVVAIGFLTEFFTHLYEKEIRSLLFKQDWFFLSLADQYQVRKGAMTFEEYIHTYGLRSDKDYELSSPRWYEIPDMIKKRIKSSQAPSMSSAYEEPASQSSHIVSDLLIIRMEAKRKALLFIDALRQAIIKKLHTNQITEYTRDELYGGKRNYHQISVANNRHSKHALRGKGIGVSIGTCSAKSLHINDNEMNILGDIVGIFPNASPEFSPQFSKCKGIIFQKGGLTSHGAIVAREFGIPAIIDAQSKSIEDGTLITMDGSTGEWKQL